MIMSDMSQSNLSFVQYLLRHQNKKIDDLIDKPIEI